MRTSTAGIFISFETCPRSFELARSHACTGRSLEAVFAECNVVTALRKTGITAFELLAELRSLGLQHGHDDFSSANCP
jgi:hypothetical protein